jgi:hypothetical protein
MRLFSNETLIRATFRIYYNQKSINIKQTTNNENQETLSTKRITNESSPINAHRTAAKVNQLTESPSNALLIDNLLDSDLKIKSTSIYPAALFASSSPAALSAPSPVKERYTNNVDTNLFDTENDESLDTYMENYTVTNLNNIVNGIVCTSGSIINNVFRPVYTIQQSSESSKFIDKLNNLLNVSPTKSHKFIFNSDSYFYNDLTKTESDSDMNIDQH